MLFDTMIDNNIFISFRTY